jgi:transposase
MSEKKRKKMELLQEQCCLNPNPELVTDAQFRDQDFFDPLDLVQVKYEMLRKVDVDKLSVTEAAQNFGFSRPSFYKAKNALEKEGLMGLSPKKRGPRTRHKVTQEILSFVNDLFDKQGDLSMAEVTGRIKKRFGVTIHPRTIERALKNKKKFL